MTSPEGQRIQPITACLADHPSCIASLFHHLRPWGQHPLLALWLNASQSPMHHTILAPEAHAWPPSNTEQLWFDGRPAAAREVILVHQHRDEQVCPTAPDVLLTWRLMVWADALKVTVRDHLILSGSGRQLYSFLRHGLTPLRRALTMLVLGAILLCGQGSLTDQGLDPPVGKCADADHGEIATADSESSPLSSHGPAGRHP